MDTLDRFREAAQTLGIEVNSATTVAQIKALMGHRASHNKRPAPDEGDHVPDEDVFRANEKDKNCNDTEIDARWNWVKKVVLVGSDMPMPIELVAENQSNLNENGWSVILKEKTQWHFRKTDAKKAAKVEAESSAARAQMREDQETEYALSQVADFIKETQGEPGNVSQKEEQVPISANNDDIYKRRLALALVMQGIDLTTAHKFSNMVFAGVEPWTVEEKRDLVAMMKVIKPNGAATNAEAGLPVTEATVATVEADGTEVCADSKSDAKSAIVVAGQSKLLRLVRNEGEGTAWAFKELTKADGKAAAPSAAAISSSALSSKAASSGADLKAGTSIVVEAGAIATVAGSPSMSAVESAASV